MKKLNLDVDRLTVDTFEPQAVDAERGTVRAHVWSQIGSGCDSQYDATCHGYGTCGIYPCRPVP